MQTVRSWMPVASLAVAALVLSTNVRAKEVRRGRQRHRDQDRPHQALQRPCLGLRDHRQDHRGLLREGQRRRRHQWTQDQLHHPG